MMKCTAIRKPGIPCNKRTATEAYTRTEGKRKERLTKFSGLYDEYRETVGGTPANTTVAVITESTEGRVYALPF